MGWFSDKKIITVASSAYNLAGEEKDRPQFLQSLIVRNILSGTKDSMGDTIQTGYLNGPAMRLRQFFRWARQPVHYGEVGMPTGQISTGSALNPRSVEAYIPHPAGSQVWCQHAVVGSADYSYWAEEWVMNNRPADLDKAWVATHNSTTNKITIRFPNATTVIFTPVNFYIGSNYIYMYYLIVNNGVYGPDKLKIYRVGSGTPGLDALVSTGSSYGEFFPFIPIRIDNKFISPSYEGKAYKQTKKAFQKATGGHLDELIENLKDNDDLDDIDYAYVVFGVSLNVVEMSCKRYLYTFFEKLMFSQKNGPQAYQKYLAAVTAANQQYANWNNWGNNQEEINRGGHDHQRSVGAETRGGESHDAPNDNEPPRPAIPAPPTNSIRITGKSNLDTDYDTRINWSYITNGTGSGKGRPGARTNDCWLVYMGEDKVNQLYHTDLGIFSGINQRSFQKFRIYWQRSATSFTYLDVVGMTHRNEIYGGKSVTITVKEALEDASESGFIIPLHYETWRATPIIDSTQMGTACVFMVANSYQVTKKKWYESGIFRIFLVVIIAIVSVVLTGGAGLGLLGAHLSVGSALGFSGMTAAIVGSVVNALAALVLTTILEKVAGAFGVLGPVIAAVLGIMIGNIISSFQAGGSFVMNWGQFLRADNLLKLTDAVGGGIQKMIQESTMGIVQKMEDVAKQTNEELRKIKEAYYNEFGYGQVVIDPMDLFVDAKTVFAESSSSFLSRTTLTGTDIAEMSQDMLSNFAEYSIKLPNAFV